MYKLIPFVVYCTSISFLTVGVCLWNPSMRGVEYPVLVPIGHTARPHDVTRRYRYGYQMDDVYDAIDSKMMQRQYCDDAAA